MRSKGPSVLPDLGAQCDGTRNFVWYIFTKFFKDRYRHFFRYQFFPVPILLFLLLPFFFGVQFFKAWKSLENTRRFGSCINAFLRSGLNFWHCISYDRCCNCIFVFLWMAHVCIYLFVLMIHDIWTGFFEVASVVQILYYMFECSVFALLLLWLGLTGVQVWSGRVFSKPNLWPVQGSSSLLSCHQGVKTTTRELLSGQRAKGRCWGKRFNGERKTMQSDKRPDKLAHVCSSCLFVPRSHLLSNRRLPLMAPQGFYLHPWTLANRETFPFFPCISFSGVISVVRIWADLTSVPGCISEHCWWTIQTFVRQLIAFAHLFQQF